MTEREAPPGWGFDYRQDPYEDDGWFGREQIPEHTPAGEVNEHPVSEPLEQMAAGRYEAPAVVAPPPPTRPAALPTVHTWTVNGQLRAPDRSTLTFRPPPAPWYRTKQAAIALVAVASVAVTAPAVMLFWPDSSSTVPGQSRSVAPQASTTAQPIPSSAEPTPVNVPPPPPLPPPPPPPPTEANDSADTQPDWTPPAAPEPTQKPDIGVRRTPVTRAPISVAPQPRQPPQNNSANPGDGRKGWRCGGWC